LWLNEDEMHRRRFIALLGSALAPPGVAAAQQRAMPVIGLLGSTSPEPLALQLAAFRQGLSEAVYIEGKNLANEYRWADGHYDRLPPVAGDLVSRKVDVIVASGSVPLAAAAKNATSTIPIVFIGVADPVVAGLAASLARPGGNLTGFSLFQFELMPKRIELLTELVPQVRVIALLVNPNDPTTEGLTRGVQDAVRAKGGRSMS
jgi:putative ABC transport system substrate-binding protein